MGSGAHDRLWRVRAGGKEGEQGEDGAPRLMCRTGVLGRTRSPNTGTDILYSWITAARFRGVKEGVTKRRVGLDSSLGIGIQFEAFRRSALRCAIVRVRWNVRMEKLGSKAQTFFYDPHAHTRGHYFCGCSAKLETMTKIRSMLGYCGQRGLRSG